MTRKQVFGVVVVVVGLVFILVYRQFSSGIDTGGLSVSKTDTSRTGSEAAAFPKQPVKVKVPDSIDGITDDIVSESSDDLTALDDEEASSLDQVDQDSESVNNLGTSYDENNL